MNQRINYEADVCGKVPLHQTNLIQPHGVLLIVGVEDYKILQASENALSIFGISARELVLQSLMDFIPKEQADKLKDRLDKKPGGKFPFGFQFSNGNHLAAIQLTGPYLVIEIEKDVRPPASNETFLSIYEELKFAMNAVEATNTVEETCNVAITELKRISGFDKIMIYKFDEEWNGDTVAEVKEEGMDAYLGLKFPSSDIPKQARELYRRTPYRLIPNIHYDPIRLYPVLNPLTNAFTDLSNSNLRSVATVHLEYLNNMGVKASMSTRILVNGKLWGLIACHHRDAKYLSFELCSVFELLSNVISAKISSVENSDLFELKEQKQTGYSKIVEGFYKHDNLWTAFNIYADDILELLGANGTTLVFNNKMESCGVVPTNNEIEEISIWLRSSGLTSAVQYPALASVFEPGANYTDKASGLLVLPIQPGKNSFLLAFRPEIVRTVDWGGNPNDAVQFEQGNKNYHPRDSFRLWKQTVHQTALPWKGEELEMAEKLRGFIAEFALSKLYS